MGNKLTELMKAPTLTRTAKDYEDVYNEFVSFAGGGRIDKLYTIPPNTDNADYIFLFQDCEVALELKQVTKYQKYNSVSDYFTKELKERKLRKYKIQGENKIEISPESLSKSQWNQFYFRFRPSITNNLNKAAGQLKDTDTHILPTNTANRFKGVILINTNDYNLPTDLLHRLIEWKVKKEWKNGKYSSIDFVTCTTIDMYKEGQSPLYARHIARTLDNPILVNAIAYLYEKWIDYVAKALNLAVSKSEGKEFVERSKIDLVAPFQGKILFNE